MDDACDIGTVEVQASELVRPDLTLEVGLWLEGPWNEIDLNTALSDVLPERDPYLDSASVASDFFSTSPGTNVVDWIWLELRTGDPEASMTVEATTAALLMRNGTVKATDATRWWSPQAGQAGYLSADFNLNAQVQNDDKNLLWNLNAGRGSQVPNARFETARAPSLRETPSQ